MKMGSTWWLVATLSDEAHGPHHSKFRQDQAQKSKYGFWLGGCFDLGMVSWEDSAGWMNRFPAICPATSERIDAFFAFVSKFFRAEAVAVEALNMEMYASISGSGGGSLYA
jgi:hypothetical protein